MPELDRIDRRILSSLQSDGRLSNAELAARVGLSESPCSRRVRRLEQDGLISGYHAHFDQERMGVGFTVFVGVRLRRHADQEVSVFEAWARDRPEVAACFLVSGEIDYLLHVAVTDLRAYDAFLSGHLLKNEVIDDIRSNIAVRAVKRPFGVTAAIDVEA